MSFEKVKKLEEIYINEDEAKTIKDFFQYNKVMEKVISQIDEKFSLKDCPYCGFDYGHSASCREYKSSEDFGK